MGKENIIKGQKVSQEKFGRAKELRKEMTPAERRLWNMLRANRFSGWHFRRQQIIAGFIVDFYCHKAGLIIEVDGPIHQKQKMEDTERSKVLSDQDLRILQFTNGEVMNKMSQTLQTILKALKSDSPFFQERG